MAVRPEAGDLVSAVDEYGRAVSGEAFGIGGGYLYIQPFRQRDAAGQYFDLPPVRVAEKDCTVVERLADRTESFAQRDRRVAEIIERFEALKLPGQERDRGPERSG
jgi:hypothetical protein